MEPEITQDSRRPLAPLGIFVGMFIWPRQTVRAILNSGPSKLVTIILVVVSGARSGVLRGLNDHYEDALKPLSTALASAMAARAVGSMVGFLLLGWMYYAIGQAFGGSGRLGDIYHGFARTLIPTFLGFAPLAAMVALASIGQAHSPAYLGIVLVYIALMVWSMVSLIRGLAEAHRFSSWASLGTFTLCAVIFVVIVFVIAFVVMAISP